MSFLEFIILTEKHVGESFIKGYLRGKGETVDIINLEKEELQSESFQEKIVQFLHPGEEILHLLLPEEKKEVLKEAIKKANEERIFSELKGTRKHTKICAQFEARIYEKEKGEKFKKILKEEKDIAIKFNKELKETLFEENKGVELYAPYHSYELYCSGSMEGEIQAALNLIRKMREIGVDFKKILLK